MDKDNFWKYVVATGDCLEWQKSKDRDGYGKFRGKMAHRLAYSEIVGEIPDGLQIDHLCRKRDCVNPEHLEPVTPRENTLRGNTLASFNATKPYCKNGHTLEADNVYKSSIGWRICKMCSNERSRRQYWKKKGVLYGQR